MKLTGEQIETIKREFKKKHPERIARALKVDVANVKKVIRKLGKEQHSKPFRPLLQISWYLLLLTFLLLPWGYSDLFYQNNLLPKRLIVYCGVSIALFFWFAAWIRSLRWSIKVSYLHPIGGLFVSWALLSAFWSVNAYEALQQSIYWLFCFLLFFLLTQLVDNIRQIKILLWTVFVSGSLVSTVGIFQYFEWINWYYQEVSPAVTFVNKNMAAQCALLIIPSGCCLGTLARQKSTVWLVSLGLCLCLAFIYYSLSRAVWLALFVLTLYYLMIAFVHWRRKKLGREFFKLRMLPMVSTFIALLFLLHLGPNGWQSIESHTRKKIAPILKMVDNNREKQNGNANPAERSFSRIQRSFSSASRIIWWKNSFQMFQGHWFLGVGVFNFQIFYPLTMIDGPHDREAHLFSHLLQPHNDWIQLAVELGLPFILLAGIAAMLITRYFFKVLRGVKNASLPYSFASLIAFGALVSLAINAFFSFPLYQAVPPVYLAIYATIFVVGIKTEKRGNKRWTELWNTAFQSSLWLNSSLLILLLAGLTFNAWIHYNWSMADHNFHKLRSALEVKNYDAMILYANRIISHNPEYASAYEVKARALMEKDRLDESLVEFQKCLEKFPHSTLVLYGLARCQFKMGRFDQALETVDYALSIIPYAADLYILKASIFKEINRPEEALNCYHKACQFKPQNASNFVNYGIAACRLKRYEDASESFKKAIALDPEYARALEWMGLLNIFVFKQFDEGVSLLEQALAQNLESTEAATAEKIIQDIENGVLTEAIVQPSMLNIH